jgi:restriction system protein
VISVSGISRHRQGELLQAVFAVLIEHPEGLPGRDVLAEMAKRVPLNEYELGSYASSPDESRAFRSIRFHTVNCVKAGWMVKTKRTWQLTEAGRAAYERLRDEPSEFVRELSRLYYRWRSSHADVQLSHEERG